MTLTKRNGNGNRFPDLLDHFLNRDLFDDWGRANFSSTGTTLPAVNIKEKKDAFEVDMVAPGLSKKDFKVQLEGNILTISSEKQNQTEEKKDEKYARKEFSYQSFQRTFNFSKDVVDLDKIKARYEEGILHLVVPKKEEAKQKPPRLIEIA